MRPIPQIAIEFVKQREACVLRVYDDTRPDYVLQAGDACRGTLTAGYGHTNALTIGMVITQEIADAWLLQDLTEAAGRLAAVVNQLVIDDLTENQYSALISFVFNVGADPTWTIWKVLNAKQYDQVPLQLAKFVNAGGKKIQGLVNRRNAEISLWSLNEPGSIDEVLPSSVTRAALTPPTVADPTPPSRSKTIITAAVGAAAAVPVAAQQVTSAIAPYADKSHLIAQVIAVLATIAAVAAGLVALFAWLHNQNARN